MASYHGIDVGRLGYTSWEPGRTYGAGPGPGRVALSPADGLWDMLKRLVAENPERGTTRYDRGRLAGLTEATASALAIVLVGHHFVHGDAWQILTRAARDEAAAELAATGKQEDTP